MKRRLSLTRAAVTALMLPVAQAAIHACPICFQINDAHMTTGVRAAVGVLVVVTVGVVAPCAVFFSRLMKRQ
jgi:hypothetical protein